MAEQKTDMDAIDVKSQVDDQVEKIKELVRKQLNEQLGTLVEEQVRKQVNEQLGTLIEEEVKKQVEEQVGKQVEGQVKKQVEEQFGKQTKNQVNARRKEQIDIINKQIDQVLAKPFRDKETHEFLMSLSEERERLDKAEFGYGSIATATADKARELSSAAKGKTKEAVERGKEAITLINTRVNDELARLSNKLSDDLEYIKAGGAKAIEERKLSIMETFRKMFEVLQRGFEKLKEANAFLAKAAGKVHDRAAQTAEAVKNVGRAATGNEQKDLPESREKAGALERSFESLSQKSEKGEKATGAIVQAIKDSIAKTERKIDTHEKEMKAAAETRKNR